MSESKRARLSRWSTRAIDIVGASAGIAVGAPAIAGAAAFVVLSMGRPILFVQPRVGHNEEVFRLVKIRTMRSARYPGEPDSCRLTPIGQLLRRTSIDELPNLWNVLRGEMSLVGPRPILVEYLERMSPQQRRRHRVKPGLTGWAQIHGRNAQSWPERFALDVEYVDRKSLAFDLTILARTVSMLVSGRGVSAAGHVTMPRFTGEEWRTTEG